MAESVQISINTGEEDYFELLKQYLVMQAAMLNDCLKDCGVANTNQRRTICQTFGSSIGALFDQKWISVRGRKYYPLLMFSKQFVTEDTRLDAVGPVLGPDKVDDFSPLGVWAGRVLFEELNEEPKEDTMGVVGSDE